MAKRGPKPKTARTARRRANDVAGMWDPPPHLDGEALAAWHHLVALLAAAGNLERTDPILVESYALNVAILRKAREAIDEFGVTQINSKGTSIANPACAVANAATMRLKAIIESLGLCPATSKYAALKSGGSASGSKWDGLLGVIG